MKQDNWLQPNSYNEIPIRFSPIWLKPGKYFLLCLAEAALETPAILHLKAEAI